MNVPSAETAAAAHDDVTTFLAAELDPDRAENAPALEAARNGDLDAARRAFAAVLRRSLEPERYLGLPLDLGDNAFLREGESIEAAAERIVGGERISAGIPHRFDGDVDWHANPTPDGYREWTWQLNRHREWVVLAEAYRRGGDERFARRLVDELRSWRQQAPCPRGAPGDATKSWRTIEAGIRASASWPWALHALLGSEALDDGVLVLWARAWWEHGLRLRTRHRTGNWLTMEMNGLAHVGILFPCFRDADAWRDYALATLVRELGAQVHPDGFQYELSTHTHQILLRQYARLEAVCRRYDVVVPEAFRKGLERVFAVNLRMRMPDGRLPNLGNGGWHEVAPLMRPALDKYPARSDFRWAASNGDEGRPPEAASTWFPYAGYAVFRSDWGADAVWAVFDGGPFGFRHHHEDKLSLLLHAYGRLLLTEAGKHRFDGSPLHRYALSSFGHNTVLVDRQGQNRKLRFVPEHVDVQRPAGLHVRTGGRVEVADAAYDEGYGPRADTSVVHTRRVVFLRAWPGLPPLFVVIDRLRARDGREHDYEAQWHLTADRAQVDGTTARTREAGAPNLIVLASGEEPLRIAHGEWEPRPRGWRVPDRGPAEPVPCPTVVAAWRGIDSRRLFALVPLRTGEASPIRAVSGSDDPADGAFALGLAGGRVLDFDERRLLEGA